MTLKVPKWWAFIFGGYFKWGWRPNILRLTLRYYREGWNKRKSWYEFVRYPQGIGR